MYDKEFFFMRVCVFSSSFSFFFWSVSTLRRLLLLLLLLRERVRHRERTSEKEGELVPCLYLLVWKVESSVAFFRRRKIEERGVDEFRLFAKKKERSATVESLAMCRRRDVCVCLVLLGRLALLFCSVDLSEISQLGVGRKILNILLR